MSVQWKPEYCSDEGPSRLPESWGNLHTSKSSSPSPALHAPARGVIMKWDWLDVKTGTQGTDARVQADCGSPDSCVHWPCWRARPPAPEGPPGRSRWSTGRSTPRPRPATGCHQRPQTPPARWKKYSERDHSMSQENRGIWQQRHHRNPWWHHRNRLTRRRKPWLQGPHHPWSYKVCNSTQKSLWLPLILKECTEQLAFETQDFLFFLTIGRYRKDTYLSVTIVELL